MRDVVLYYAVELLSEITGDNLYHTWIFYWVKVFVLQIVT